MNDASAFRSADARALAATLATWDVPIPPSLSKAVAIADACDGAHNPPDVPVLNMTGEQAIEYAAVLARYRPVIGGTSWLPDALNTVASRAAAEAAEALRAGDLDVVIVALRPRFDAAAAVIHRAAAHGITSTTTAQQVLDLHDPDAVTVWGELSTALSAIAGIAYARQSLSEQLGVTPNRADMRLHYLADDGLIDYTVCYVAPDSNGFSTEGGMYKGRAPRNGIDWLALANSSGGRLRLNTPAESRTMLTDRARPAQPRVPLNETMPTRG